MRKLLIDIADLGGRAMPDDKVTLWAPFHRESLSNPSRVVSTARVDVVLDEEGKAEVMVDPGPLRVQFKCRGFSDTEVKKVVVPEDGDEDVLLKDILSGSYVYEPEVVSAARQAADRAEAGADRAEAGADRVGTAEQVGVWADQASTAAEATADDRRQTGEDRGVVEATAIEVADDRRQTGEDRIQTGEDREAAKEWAGQSKDSAVLAITAAATVSQYVGDGFPEGRVVAPVGAIYTDRLATAGAVRWIKTQGTGNTGWVVEYGDTGWRRETEEALLNGWTFGVTKYMQLRRVGNKVSLLIPNWSLRGTNKTDDKFYIPPNGFRPYTAGNYGHLGAIEDGSIHKDFSYLKSAVSGATSGLVEWWTNDVWPTTLPGTPA